MLDEFVSKYRDRKEIEKAVILWRLFGLIDRLWHSWTTPVIYIHIAYTQNDANYGMSSNFKF